MSDKVPKALSVKIEQTAALQQKILNLKSLQTEIDAAWKDVEQQMLDNDIKSIKGDWGSLTIAERTNWKVDLDQLPSKFVKKAPDTTKLSAHYKLTNKVPKGAEISHTKYLTKRIKEAKDD